MDRMWGNHESTGIGVSDSRAGTTPTTKLTGGVSGFWKLKGHRVLQRALSSCGFRTRHRDSPRQPAGKEHENKGSYPPNPCCCIAGASHWPNSCRPHRSVSQEGKRVDMEGQREDIQHSIPSRNLSCSAQIFVMCY